MQKINKKLLVIGSKRYKKSTVKSLIEEGEKLFEKVMFVPINKIRIVTEKGESKLYYKETNLNTFDVCYPRFSARDYYLGEAVLKILEKSKIYMPVSLKSFQIANHKFYTVMTLNKAGVAAVASTLMVSPDAVRETIKEFGFPVVIKLISGFAGKGVVLIKDEKQLNSILDTITLFEEYITAQKFITGKNADIRCYVIGKKIISVQRTAPKGEWRANISRGGTAKELKVSKAMEEAAKKAAKALDFEICAVDFIETNEKKMPFAVIEVNFMPGPFMKFLGNKITKEMISFLYEKAKEKKSNKK